MTDTECALAARYLMTQPDGSSGVVDGERIRSVLVDPVAKADAATGAGFVVSHDDGDWRFEPVDRLFDHATGAMYVHEDLVSKLKVRRDRLSTVLTLARAKWSNNAKPWILTDGTIVLLAGTRLIARYTPVKESS